MNVIKADICCIVKNEHKFIEEWIDYHLNIGFNHIYVYEDYGSDSHAELLKKYEGRVTLIPLEGNTLGVYNHYNSGTQFQLYQTHIKNTKEDNSADWVLLTDIDEFLMFEEGYNLQKLLEEYKDVSAIWLSWKMMSADGRIKSPHPELGVVEAYTKEGGRTDKDVWSVKSFINVQKYKGFKHRIHVASGGVTTRGETTLGKNITSLSYEKAWLNHYFTKSWEDYCDRMFKRGNMSNNYRTFDQFFLVNTDMLPLKNKLLNEIRYKHCVSTMWISKDLKIISGGNIQKIKELKHNRK